MLVYGDPVRTIDLASWSDRLASPVSGASAIARHAERVARLILTGQALQAVADAQFEAAGERDVETPETQALGDLLLSLACEVGASWRGARVEEARLTPPRLTGRLVAREPEGYAFYALYPELYYDAARRCGPEPQALALGLRSIGTSLAAVVAAGLGGRDLATVRPKGPVFAREIDAPDLARRLAGGPRLVAIVDEGPGLSGSSFKAGADFVRAAGPAHRRLLFPSHRKGPGGEAAPETRNLFKRGPCAFAPFEEGVLASGRLAAWAEDLVGPALGPLEDLSGGLWRARLYAREADWPAVDIMQERRKYLLRTAEGAFLLKFVGIGDGGAHKAAMARDLGQAGLAPEHVGFRHGFSIERWIDDARPLDPRADRPRLLRALGRYIGFRRRFRVEAGSGAHPDLLKRMVARNVGLALGADAGAQAARAMDALTPARVTPIATDNRMHAHEWLARHDGALLKADGVDHHAGHDLIGAQDIAYDVAAASFEFDLSAGELRGLCGAVAQASGAAVETASIAPYRTAWIAFELGRMTLARAGAGAGPEQARLDARVRYLTEAARRMLADPAWPFAGN